MKINLFGIFFALFPCVTQSAIKTLTVKDCQLAFVFTQNENRNNDTSDKLYWIKNNQKEQLFKGKQTYFDMSHDENISGDQQYVFVNKYNYGYLDDGESTSYVEKNFFAFIHMNSGCVIREETGSFCYTGHRDDDENAIWVYSLSGEKVSESITDVFSNPFTENERNNYLNENRW